MSDDGILGTLGGGLVDFVRFVSLWFGFGLGLNGLGVVLDAALVNEPFGWTLQASSAVALAAAFVVTRYYPEVETGDVWRFGAATYLAFVAVGTLGGAFDFRTNGTAYYVLRTGLVWIGAVALGCAVAWTDDWRELLPGR